MNVEGESPGVEKSTFESVLRKAQEAHRDLDIDTTLLKKARWQDKPWRAQTELTPEEAGKLHEWLT